MYLYARSCMHTSIYSPYKNILYTYNQLRIETFRIEIPACSKLDHLNVPRTGHHAESAGTK